jgi:hypothetical protein
MVRPTGMVSTVVRDLSTVLREQSSSTGMVFSVIRKAVRGQNSTV